MLLMKFWYGYFSLIDRITLNYFLFTTYFHKLTFTQKHDLALALAFIWAINILKPLVQNASFLN